MHLVLDGGGPLYDQLARALKRAVDDGRLKVGARLPATRELAAELRVSRNTVLVAYEVLRSEGWADARPGAGTFVASGPNDPRPRASPAPIAPPSAYASRLRELPSLPRMRARPPARLALEYGEPLVHLPMLNAWRAELARAVTHAVVGYPASNGLPALRAAVSDYVGRRRGVACAPGDVVIVNGTQQALTLLARVLVDESKRVAIEDPHYPFAAQALRAHGAELVFVPVDDEGLDVSALPSAGVRLVLVTPSHQFPSGVEMSPQRRARLLDYARAHDCWIIEDDYDGEFRHEPAPVPALRAMDREGRVVYVGSFSKVLFPALRLGYVVCPPALRDDVVAAKRLHDLGCSGVEQAALAGFIASGAFDRHLRKAGAELRQRRNALLTGLRRHCGDAVRPSPSRAGMHVVGWLPWATADAVTHLVKAAHDRGLALFPIDPYYARSAHQAGLLLGFASLSTKQVSEATRVLGDCLRAVRR